MGLNSILDLTAVAVLIVGILVGLGVIITLSWRDWLQKQRQGINQDPRPLSPPKNTLATSQGKVVLGMTTEDVIANWGHPTHINRIESSGSLSEAWLYCPSPECFHHRIYLIFEEGQLISWQEMRPRTTRRPLAFPPSPIRVFHQPAVHEWRQELREIRDPLVRVAVGWPMFLWRAWDWFMLSWLIKRSLKAMDRSERQLKKAWAEFQAALKAEKEEQSGKSRADE